MAEEHKKKHWKDKRNKNFRKRSSQDRPSSSDSRSRSEDFPDLESYGLQRAPDGTPLWPVLKGASAKEFIKWCEIGQSYNAESSIKIIFKDCFNKDREYPEIVFQGRIYPLPDADEELIQLIKAQNLERIKLFEKDVHERESAKRILHAKIMQRVDTVKLLDKLKLESAEWKALESENDPLRLLKLIAKVIMETKETKNNPGMTKIKATDAYTKLRMEPHENPIQFKERTLNAILVMKSLDASIPSDADQALRFIDRLDPIRFSKWQADLQNWQIMYGEDRYPKTLADACEIADSIVTPTAEGKMVLAASLIRKPKDHSNSDRSHKSTDSEDTKKPAKKLKQLPTKVKDGKSVKPENSSSESAAEKKRETGPEKHQKVYPPCPVCDGAHSAFKCPSLADIRREVKSKEEKSTKTLVTKLAKGKDIADQDLDIYMKPSSTRHVAFVTMVNKAKQEVQELTEDSTIDAFYQDAEDVVPQHPVFVSVTKNPMPFLNTSSAIRKGLSQEKIALVSSLPLTDDTILLDTCSGINCTKITAFLLEPPIEMDEPQEVIGVNKSSMTVNKMGTMLGDLPVMYDKDFIGNIWSFGYVRLHTHWYIEYYYESNQFSIRHPILGPLLFDLVAEGLYVRVSPDFRVSNSYVLINQSVEGNRRAYTKSQLKAADEASELQRLLAFPSDGKLVKMVHNIKNTDVTPHDVHRKTQITPSRPFIKGKSKWFKNKLEYKPEYIPRSINKMLVLLLDLFFFDGLVFLLSVSYPLGLSMVSQLATRKAADLLESISSHIIGYKKENFEISDIIIDGEGAIVPISDILSERFKAKVNPRTSGDHVGIPEKKISVIKQSVNSVLASLLYNLPKILLAWCILYCVSRINMWPSSAIDSDISPRETFTGIKIDKKIDLRIGFGDCAEVKSPYKDSIGDRTETCIALYPLGNKDGGVKFWNLDTKREINRSQWDDIPTPQIVIDLMNKLAKADGGISHSPIVTINPRESGHLVDIDKIVQDMDIKQDELLEQDVIDAFDPPQRELPVHYGERPSEPDHFVDVTPPLPILRPGRPQTRSITAEIEKSKSQRSTIKELKDIPDNPDHKIIQEIQIPENIQSNQLPAAAAFVKQQDNKNFIFHVKIKKALQKYNRQGLLSCYNELMGIHDKGTLIPVDRRRLSSDQLRKIIRSQIFLKEKLDPDSGELLKLKARLVAGGHMQDRSIYEDISSPTITLQSVFMLATIAAKEGRRVVTADIAQAYLNAKMTGIEVIMELDEVSTAILSHIAPDIYSKFTQENGKMLVQLDKALYGCIESARLWYFTIKDFLEADGFKVNSQDICVFNKGEGENQITIGIYVDDLFISSLNDDLINDFISKLIAEYGSDCKINEGVFHSYLSMIMDFSQLGKVKITMPQYVEEMMEQFEVEGRAATPALENLFEVREESPLLDDNLQEIFHSRVAKVLYIAKRVRPELLPTVIFLATRVKKASEDDWFKLTRMLKYINGTRELGIILEAENILSIRSYIDASFAVHPDMRSHSGACITLGKGPVFSKSSKQKLMSKSSTEAELIGLSDNFPQVIWTRNFLIEQGYDVPPGKVYQDNQSTITMVKKGRSTSERTRHINIRFFFIKDKIDNGELELEYLPTEDMVADILTKPLQGNLFKKLRNELLNWTD